MKTAVVSLLAWVLLALFAMPVLSQSSDSVCLRRTDPGKNDLITNVYPRGESAWLNKTILVHGEHNQISDCQDKGAKCHVGRWDTFEVVKDLSGQLRVIHRSLGERAKIYDATLDSRGYFIHGVQGVINPQHVFIMQTSAPTSCVKLGSNPELNYEGKQCSHFVIEVFPEKLQNWKPVRPDQQGEADWPSELCAAESMQPGGGGGHDPPP